MNDQAGRATPVNVPGRAADLVDVTDGGSAQSVPGDHYRLPAAVGDPVDPLAPPDPTGPELQGAFDAAAVLLLVIDLDHRIRHLNTAAARLLPGSAPELIGCSLVHLLTEQDAAAADLLRAALHRAASGPPGGPNRRAPSTGSGGAAGTQVEQLWLDPLGNRHRILWTFTGFAAAGQPLLVVVGADVTEQRLAEATWRARAETDPLTGLANRAGLEAALNTHLDPARGLGCGLLFCDLDAFKQVNDTYGHPAGDHLLITTARRLTATLRTGDLVARIGGDEFVAVLPAAGPIETRAAAARLEKAINAPVRLEAATVRVGVSIGQRIANAGEHARCVLADADAAMYAVKARRSRLRTA